MGGSTAIDLTGQVFGLLTAVRREGRIRRFAAWLCRCTCGIEVVVSSDHLRGGRRKACARNGHYWAGAKYPPGFLKKYRSEYLSWEHMHERCRYTRHKNWKNYGARGITVCERWKDFNLFVADLGRKPTPAHTIERNDVNGNYEPSNCRWATRKEQSRNLRRSVYVEVEGVKVLLIEVTEKLGLDRSSVYGRLKNGWSLEEALSIPVHKRDSIMDEAEKLGLDLSVVRGRLKNGWTREEALSTPVHKRSAVMDKAAQLGLSLAMVRGRLKNGWTEEEALSTPVRKHKAQLKCPQTLALKG